VWHDLNYLYLVAPLLIEISRVKFRVDYGSRCFVKFLKWILLKEVIFFRRLSKDLEKSCRYIAYWQEGRTAVLRGLRHVRENLFRLGHGFFSLLCGCAFVVWMDAWGFLVKAKNVFPSSRVNPSVRLTTPACVVCAVG